MPAKLLPPGHPNFCAKCVCVLGDAEEKRGEFLLKQGDSIRVFTRYAPGRFNVGDKVILAKRLPTLRGWPKKYRLTMVTLPWNYQHYKSWHTLPKTFRKLLWKPYAALTGQKIFVQEGTSRRLK